MANVLKSLKDPATMSKKPSYAKYDLHIKSILSSCKRAKFEEQRIKMGEAMQVIREMRQSGFDGTPRKNLYFRMIDSYFSMKFNINEIPLDELVIMANADGATEQQLIMQMILSSHTGNQFHATYQRLFNMMEILSESGMPIENFQVKESWPKIRNRNFVLKDLESLNDLFCTRFLVAVGSSTHQSALQLTPLSHPVTAKNDRLRPSSTTTSTTSTSSSTATTTTTTTTTTTSSSSSSSNLLYTIMDEYDLKQLQQRQQQSTATSTTANAAAAAASPIIENSNVRNEQDDFQHFVINDSASLSLQSEILRALRTPLDSSKLSPDDLFLRNLHEQLCFEDSSIIYGEEEFPVAEYLLSYESLLRKKSLDKGGPIFVEWKNYIVAAIKNVQKQLAQNSETFLLTPAEAQLLMVIPPHQLSAIIIQSINDHFICFERPRLSQLAGSIGTKLLQSMTLILNHRISIDFMKSANKPSGMMLGEYIRFRENSIVNDYRLPNAMAPSCLLIKILMEHYPFGNDELSAITPVFLIDSRYSANTKQKQSICRLNGEFGAIFPFSNSLGTINRPNYMPMVMKPKPWISHRNGGFINLKSSFFRVFAEKRNDRLIESHSLSLVFRALNYIGSTKWKVNDDVLNTAKLAWTHEKFNGVWKYSDLQEDMPLLPFVDDNLNVIPTTDGGAIIRDDDEWQQRLDDEVFAQKLQDLEIISSMDTYKYGKASERNPAVPEEYYEWKEKESQRDVKLKWKIYLTCRRNNIKFLRQRTKKLASLPLSNDNISLYEDIYTEDYDRRLISDFFTYRLRNFETKHLKAQRVLFNRLREMKDKKFFPSEIDIQERTFGIPRTNDLDDFVMKREMNQIEIDKEKKQYPTKLLNSFKNVFFEKKNAEAFSLNSYTAAKLSLADALKSRDIYFPHNIDFRGRSYPIPTILNHMGDDFSRGLLRFSESVPLGPEGLNWLKIHCANLFGQDKLSFKMRLKYIDDNFDDIVDSAINPINGRRFWVHAESPWQALSICQELARIYKCDNPENFLSTASVHQDGSCNGLQHYAAIGRDLRGGELVGLVDSDLPRDIYSEVLKTLKKTVEAETVKIKEKSISLPRLSRKLIKQTVMTSVYGVTKIGATAQIKRQLLDVGVPEDEAHIAASYLSTKTLQSLGEVFSSAKGIMEWLGEVASLINATKKPVSWVTPLGLPVIQPYFDLKQTQRKTVLGDISFQSPSDTVSTRKQSSGIAPNFVHSLDSSHMMLTAVKCKDNDIIFAAVHDSYWCHAGNASNMNRLLREAFVELHSTPILENFSVFCSEKYGIETPPIPPKGNLNIEDVLKSKFFFD